METLKCNPKKRISIEDENDSGQHSSIKKKFETNGNSEEIKTIKKYTTIDNMYSVEDSKEFKSQEPQESLDQGLQEAVVKQEPQVDQKPQEPQESQEPRETQEDEQSQESQESYDDGEFLPTYDQQKVIQYLENFVTNTEFRSKNPNAILVTGPAGTGKTRLFQYIDEYARNTLKKPTICVSTMGVSALHFEHGKTSHSMFGFPRKFENEEDFASCRLNCDEHFKDALFEEISRAYLIIYDNVNMEDSRKIEFLNKFLQKRMGSSMPFGEKLIMFGADFFQVAPISFSGISFALSTLFGQLRTFFVNNDNNEWNIEKQYFQLLDAVREGQTHFSLTDLNFTEDIQNVIDFVFPEEVFKYSDACAKRVILNPYNSETNEINNTIMKQQVINNNIKVISYTRQTVENHEKYDNVDEKDILPPEILQIWRGSLCMIVRTIDHASGLLVGARVIVEHMGEDEIIVRIPGTDDKRTIERRIFKNNGQYFSQFPLKLGYATTVHRAQGQRFERVGVDLQREVFTHGQLYQALSRVRSREDIIVCPSSFAGVDVMVKNIMNKNITDNCLRFYNMIPIDIQNLPNSNEA